MPSQISKLVLRAQSGDGEALSSLITHIAPDIARYVSRITREPSLADDVAQDTLVQICRKLRHLRNPEVFRYWALRIASRRAFRAMAKRRIDVSLDDKHARRVEDPRARDEVERGVASEMVLRLLHTVSPASRAVLTLHYLEGYTLLEVADILEIPIGTAKSRLNYGISALRKHSAPSEGDV